MLAAVGAWVAVAVGVATATVCVGGAVCEAVLVADGVGVSVRGVRVADGGCVGVWVTLGVADGVFVGAVTTKPPSKAPMSTVAF